MLSPIEKLIFLKDVIFFQGLSMNQLKIVAAVCEEEFFPEGALIYEEGDPGGRLYILLNGQVSIERRNKAQGTVANLATLERGAYFGEASLFDNSPMQTAARATQDTLMLRLSHEPLTALIKQYPDLSLHLVIVLSQRLREADEQMAEVSRRRSRTMHKLYDKLD